MQIVHADGKREYVVSGRDWDYRTPGAGSIADQLAGGDGWQRPVSLGAHGVGPWKRLAAPGQDGPKGPPASMEDIASLLSKPPAELSDEDSVRIGQAFRRAAPLNQQRFNKALSVEEGIIKKQLGMKGQSTVMVMDLRSKNEAPMLDRGEYDKRGEVVKAGVPHTFRQLPDGEQADRLALARWLIADDNPLTARVAVNRYWQLLFGQGIVRTSEDFGAQGEWPSHPELLDALAVRFREGGWDIRGLLREIVMSDTYQQQSDIDATQQERDPANRLLGRGARGRLQAELVRDNALAISGKLDRTLGGPSVYPSQPDGLWRQVSHFGYGQFTAQAYFADQGSDTSRRSLYTFWKL